MKKSFLIIFCFSLFVFARGQKNDSIKIVITNIGKAINSPFAEYSPAISADGMTMIFTSRRPVTEKEVSKNKQGKENIYISSYDTIKKKWKIAERLSDVVNEPNRHNSAKAISNDGQRMLIYRDDESANGDLYISELNGNEWSATEKLPEPINSKYHESTASISPDGTTIYFVSNRPGGIGGRDIWMCKQDDYGKWGEVKNLEKPINTEEDEESIFIHPDGKTIYYSSKGRTPSKGGYDIYKSVNTNGKWSKPTNLGAPINTKDDDLCFVVTADGLTAYYASAKDGGQGERDLYEIKFIPKEKKTGPQLTLLKGTITDEISGKPLESSIEIKDLETNKVVTKIKSNSATGKYLVSLPSNKNYGITVNADKYLFHSVNVDIPPATTSYQEIIKDIQLKKYEIGKRIVLNNIFYDFDKATLRTESLSELERMVKLMNENPSMKVEISSHTDNIGSEEYNISLSQARAQSVVDYLISKGVTKERLIAKGYGKSMPIATNETEEGRQLNRRTEFKIVSI
ncbi:MAG: OmpA family protein [Bacteroidota bacterium]